MDWDQKVNTLLNSNEDETDVLIVDPHSILVSHQAGPYSEHKLNILRKEIEKTTKSNDSK